MNLSDLIQRVRPIEEDLKKLTADILTADSAGYSSAIRLGKAIENIGAAMDALNRLTNEFYR